MKAIIDSDTIAFSCAATAEDSEEWVAHARANEMVERILAATNATEYELWLSGLDNFRYSIYPEYKANRLDSYRPKWEKSVKDFLTDQWNANWSVGCEADDMCGVRSGPGTIICHIDKDLNQIPGLHYNWELTRLGKVIKPETIYEVTPEEGLRYFHYQLIVGDTTDNIKGIPGYGPKKAEKLLDCPLEEQLDVIRSYYSCDEELELNGGVLWIWKKMNDIWSLKHETAIKQSKREELPEIGA